jgi:hypothetical protein
LLILAQDFNTTPARTKLTTKKQPSTEETNIEEENNVESEEETPKKQIPVTKRSTVCFATFS